MENIELKESKMTKVLDWAYEQAVNGIPGLHSAKELAETYIKEYPGNPAKQTDAIIRWQTTKAATSGFLTGLGGFITIPVTIPTNMVSVLYIQLRMIASIAYINGYDLKDDKVRTMVYMCLVGDVVKETVKNFGVKLGEKIAISIIKGISSETIKSINRKVAFKLFTKFGEKGLINLGKLVPVIGGGVSASFDAVSTNAVGKMAKRVFA